MGGGREDGEWQEEEGSEVGGPVLALSGVSHKRAQVTDLRVLLFSLN